ncbi:unnamed protein product [Aphanomyces euteiches]
MLFWLIVLSSFGKKNYHRKMDAFMNHFTTKSFDFAALLKTNDISASVQKHLAKVYTTLAITVLVAAAGVLADMMFDLVGIISSIASFALVIALAVMDTRDVTKRLNVLMGIAFTTGVNLGPLISLALDVHPMIVVSAFLGTAVVFACFTGSAMLEKRRSYFYLYAAISSGVLCLTLLQLINIFVKSHAMYTMELYMGLLIFCGYVLVDTQMIIEKASLGDRDFVSHTLELFLDFVSLFVRVLLILLEKAKDDKEEDKD